MDPYLLFLGIMILAVAAIQLLVRRSTQHPESDGFATDLALTAAIDESFADHARSGTY